MTIQDFKSKLASIFGQKKVEGAAAPTTAAKPYVLKQGSQDHKIVQSLKALRGGDNGENFTVDEMASMIPRARGVGENGETTLDPVAFRNRLSVLADFFDEAGKGDDFAKLLPRDYIKSEGQGRRAKPPLTGDALDSLLEE